jgi:hypothetical protein
MSTKSLKTRRRKEAESAAYGALAPFVKPRNRLCVTLPCPLADDDAAVTLLTHQTAVDPFPFQSMFNDWSCRPASRHLLCKGLDPVGTFLLQSPTSSGDGAGAIGSSGAGAMTTNADVRAASTAVNTVEPRKEECRRAAMRSQEPSSPTAAGLLSPRRRRQQPTILIRLSPDGWSSN